jgi:hypothetical protein
LENISNTKLTSTHSGKFAHAMIGITKLVIKYCYRKIAYLTNQKAGMKVILGLSHPLMQMGQSGFNTE